MRVEAVSSSFGDFVNTPYFLHPNNLRVYLLLYMYYYVLTTCMTCHFGLLFQHFHSVPKYQRFVWCYNSMITNVNDGQK